MCSIFFCRAHGLVNGMKFDNKTVMLVSIPQNVTGQKTFRGNNSRLFFHNFEIKNEINNISLNELLKNQVNLRICCQELIYNICFSVRSIKIPTRRWHHL